MGSGKPLLEPVFSSIIAVFSSQFTMLALLFLSPLVVLAQKLNPPTSDPRPTCNRRVCATQRVLVKVYIDDLLWEQYTGWNKRQRGGVGLSLDQRVSRVVEGINSHLARLDNG